MTEKKALRAFLSYNSVTTAAEADLLRSALQSAGVKVLPERFRLPKGELRNSLINEMRSCSLFILLLSPGDEYADGVKAESQVMLEACWENPDARIFVLAPAVGAIPKGLRHQPFVQYVPTLLSDSRSSSSEAKWQSVVASSLSLLEEPNPTAGSAELSNSDIRAWRNRLVHIGASEALKIDQREREQIREQLVSDLDRTGRFAAVSLEVGATDLEIAERLMDRASIALAIEEFDLALDYNRRLSEISAELMYNDQLPADVLYNLGIADFEAGALLSAETRFRTALELYRNTYGDSHPATAAAAYNLGLTMQEQGRFSDAIHCYRSALNYSLRSVGEVHPQTSSILTNLGQCLRRLGRLEEARAALERARKGMLRSRPLDGPEIHAIDEQLRALP